MIFLFLLLVISLCQASYELPTCKANHVFEGPICVPCPGGTYRLKYDPDTCFSCPADKYSKPGRGCKTCKPTCIMSKTRDNCHCCPNGSILHTSQCVKCPRNFVANPEKTMCVCAQGYETCGVSRCKKCKANMYSTGGVKCKNCPFGYVVNAAQSACDRPNPGVVMGFVFQDNNGDSEFTPDEAIGAVKVNLLDSKGKIIDTTESKTKGDYSFINVPPGSYSVHIVLPSGFTAGTDFEGAADGKAKIVVVSDEVLDEVNFQLVAVPGIVMGFVFQDTNGDSEFTPDEAVGSVKINLLDSKGKIIDKTESKTHGDYSFTQIPPGSYSVHIVIPSGFTAGNDYEGAADGKAKIVVVSNEVLDEVNFQLIPQTGAVMGFVFQDTNGDSKFTPDEAVGSVKINLLDSKGKIIDTTESKTLGDYSFTKVSPGAHSIHIVVPSGFTSGPDYEGAADGKAKIVVVSNEVLDEVNFQVIPKPGTVKGIVFQDTNGDSKFTPDEAIGSVKVNLLDSKRKIVRTTESKSKGDYSFTKVPPGSYSVHIVVPSGFTTGTDFEGAADGKAKIVVFSNMVLDKVNFQLVPKPGVVMGFVFQDTNGDSKFTPDEAVGSVKLNLLDSNGKIFDTTESKSKGDYSFVKVPPGSYSVHIVVPAEFTAGPDYEGTDDGKAKIVIVSDTLLDEVNFQLVPKPGVVMGFVFQDTNGDSKFTPDEAVGSVKLNLLDSKGKIVGTTESKSKGDYSFTKVPPGSYSVHIVVPSGFTAGTDYEGAADGKAKIVVVSDTVLDEVNFQLVPKPGTVKGIVFQDTNVDSKNSPGESITSVKVNLLDSTGKAVGTTSTNSKGEYSFTKVPPGSYSVHIVLPPRYSPGPDYEGPADGKAKILVVSNTVLDRVNFQVIPPPGMVMGFVYEDKDSDKSYTPTEGIVSVSVDFLDSDGKRLASTKTGAEGEFFFTRKAGRYTIVVYPPTGFSQGHDNDGVDDGKTNIELKNAIFLTDINFSLIPR